MPGSRHLTKDITCVFLVEASTEQNNCRFICFDHLPCYSNLEFLYFKEWQRNCFILHCTNQYIINIES